MITRVSGFNFKGLTGGYDLTGKDIFVGYMGAGKTTVIQALTLALLGCVPENGKPMKRPIDSMRFASADLMSVGIETDAGFSINRTFKTKGQNYTSSLDILPASEARTDEEKEQKILDEIGYFSLALNVDEFVSMSAAQKKMFVFGLADVDKRKWNRDAILAICTYPDKLLASWPETMEVRGGLESFLEAVQNEISYLQRDKKKSEAACQRLSQARSDQSRTGVMSIAELRAEGEVLQKDLTEIEKQSTRDEERLKAASKRVIAIQKAETKKKTLEAKIMNLKTDKAEIEKDIEQRKADLTSMNPGISHPDTEMDVLKTNLIGKKSIIDQYRENIKKLESPGADLCPFNPDFTCRHDIKGSLELKIEPMEKDHERVVRLLAAMIMEQEAYKNHQNAVDMIKSMEISLSKIEKEIEEKEGLSAEPVSELSESRKESKEDLESHGHIVDTDSLLAEKEGILQRMKAVKDEIRKAEAEKVLMTEYQNAQTAKLRAEADLLELQNLKKRLGPNGVLGEITKESIGPIIETVNNIPEFKTGYRFAIRTQDRKGSEIFDLGWENKETGSFIPMEALSDGESVIFITMLMAALMKLKSPKTGILMIDNADKISPDFNLELFVNALSFISDFIRNIIICSNRDVGISAGWRKTILLKQN